MNLPIFEPTMTYILLIAFVWGIGKVVHSFFEFFEWDYDIYYQLAPLWLKFILKPTIYCNICMSSFWGLFFYYLILSPLNTKLMQSGYDLPIFLGYSFGEAFAHCVICAGAIFVIDHLID